jgi:hypothetical protein
MKDLFDYISAVKRLARKMAALNRRKTVKKLFLIFGRVKFLHLFECFFSSQSNNNSFQTRRAQYAICS